MLLSHSKRKDHASMPSNTESLLPSESMKDKSDFSESSQGNIASLKTVVSKKKMNYSLCYWLLMICFLLVIVGSAVFIFYSKGSGNKAANCYRFILLEYDKAHYNNSLLYIYNFFNFQIRYLLKRTQLEPMQQIVQVH